MDDKAESAPETGNSGDPTATPLQFDTVEPAAGAAPPTAGATVQCFSCSRPIDNYFELNGKIVCNSCRANILHHFTGPMGFSRFAMVALKGAGAAAVGSLLFYGVRAITGYELGLVGILVGYFVGITVNKGSNSRGGWRMQTLAIALTYLAIVSTYVPAMLKMTDNVVLIAGVALIAPFLAGAQNFMGILIIGFALYQAWKMNKRPTLAVTGPFRVSAPEAVAV